MPAVQRGCMPMEGENALEAQAPSIVPAALREQVAGLMARHRCRPAMVDGEGKRMQRTRAGGYLPRPWQGGADRLPHPISYDQQVQESVTALERRHQQTLQVAAERPPPLTYCDPHELPECWRHQAHGDVRHLRETTYRKTRGQISLKPKVKPCYISRVGLHTTLFGALAFTVAACVVTSSVESLASTLPFSRTFGCPLDAVTLLP